MQLVIENGVLKKLTAPYFTHTVRIPEEVTAIGERAFEGFGMLESVTLPEHLTSIGAHAFRGCGNLKRLAPASQKRDIFLLPESVTGIGDEAFMRCHKMELLFLPYPLTTVGSRILRDCGSLKNICLYQGETVHRFGIARISPFGMWRSDWFAEILLGDFIHAETPEEWLLICCLYVLGLTGSKAEDWLVSHADAFFQMMKEYPSMLAALYLNHYLKPLLASDRIAAEIPPDLLEILVQDANKQKDYEMQMRLSELGKKYDSLGQFQNHYQL